MNRHRKEVVMRRWVVYFKKYDTNFIPYKWNEGFNADTKEDAIQMCKDKYGDNLYCIEDCIPAYQVNVPLYHVKYGK